MWTVTDQSSAEGLQAKGSMVVVMYTCVIWCATYHHRLLALKQFYLDICNTKKHMGIIFFICAAENKILL